MVLPFVLFPVHFQPWPRAVWFNSTSELLNFGAAIMNLGLWGALLANRKRDPQFVAVSIGLGVVVTGAALSYGLLHLLPAQRGGTIPDIFLMLTQLAGWSIWCRAFWPVPRRSAPAPESPLPSPPSPTGPEPSPHSWLCCLECLTSYKTRVLAPACVLRPRGHRVHCPGARAGHRRQLGDVQHRGLTADPPSLLSPARKARFRLEPRQSRQPQRRLRRGFHGLARAIQNLFRPSRLDAHRLRPHRRGPPAPGLGSPCQREFFPHPGREARIGPHLSAR